MEEELQCKRNGCKKKYLSSMNTSSSCHHHPGKPIFHDLKKGWTCCNKIVYDWDEFERLPTCAVAQHVDQLVVDGGEFFKSNTVAQAQKGIEMEQKKIKIQNIDDFTKQKEQERKL